jgi:hypothetical protein
LNKTGEITDPCGIWWHLHAVLGAVLNVHEEINGIEQMVLDNIDCQVESVIIRLCEKLYLPQHIAVESELNIVK